MATDPKPDAGGESAFESSYDAYLDACLEGSATPPDAWCAKHGITDPALVKRIVSLYEAMGAKQAAVGVSRGAGRTAALPYERIGDYRLVRRLGAGGMGEVFLAEQQSLGRLVALKVIRPELQDHDTIAKRFEREAKAVARLRHAGIVQVYELGQEGELSFIAMELVAGQSLDELLRAGPLNVDDVLRWGTEVADALAYAHGEGVVHRDVKPSNIIITPEGRAVLLDFGMVHLADTDATRLTHTFAGSPGYAAPEQIQSGDVDERTDVYALGVTLYECLTGSMPFPGSNLSQVFRAILTELPATPSKLREELTRDIDLVLLKCLEKRAADRYPSIAGMRADLQALRDARKVSARPPGAWRRLVSWCRRRPVHAAALFTFLAAALIFVIWKLDDAAKQRQRARDLVSAALADVDRYADLRDAIVETQRKLEAYGEAGKGGPPDEASMRAHDALLDEDGRQANALPALADEIEAKLREAARLDPEVPGQDRVRAELALRRMENATRLRDTRGVARWRAVVRKYDPDGHWTGITDDVGTLEVITEPAGAAVFMWPYRVQRDVYPEVGARRMVPVSRGPAPAGVRYGQFAFRVVKPVAPFHRDDVIIEVAGGAAWNRVLVMGDAGPLKRADQLVRIDDVSMRHPDEVGFWARKRPVGPYVFRRGQQLIELTKMPEGLILGTPWQLLAAGGTPVRVWANGTIDARVAPAGMTLRPTATPVYLRPEHDRLGRGGEIEATLEPGQYLFLVRQEGMEDAWLGCRIDPGREHALTVRLIPEGTTPKGFVYYPEVTKDRQPFWIMEREVTAGEYIEFVNDPLIRASIDARKANFPDELIRVPRDSRSLPDGGFWPRGEDGLFRLGPAWLPSHPVMGVSFDDARSYAGWRSVQDGVRYELPEHVYVLASGGGYLARRFVFGNDIRHTWVSSNWAYAKSGLKRVMQFPIDQSPSGVFDLAGSMREWTASVWGRGENPGVMHVFGHDWADPAGKWNAFGPGIGEHRTRTIVQLGFRLMLRWENRRK